MCLMVLMYLICGRGVSGLLRASRWLAPTHGSVEGEHIGSPLRVSVVRLEHQKGQPLRAALSGWGWGWGLGVWVGVGAVRRVLLSG